MYPAVLQPKKSVLYSSMTKRTFLRPSDHRACSQLLSFVTANTGDSKAGSPQQHPQYLLFHSILIPRSRIRSLAVSQSVSLLFFRQTTTRSRLEKISFLQLSKLFSFLTSLSCKTTVFCPKNVWHAFHTNFCGYKSLSAQNEHFMYLDIQVY